MTDPHFSLSLYCASTDQPWWLFCWWSSSTLSGTHLDDQLDLWHTEPIFCLSHPEASSPAPILWNWIGTFILMFVFWVSVWDALWPRLHIISNVPKERILGLPHRKNLKLVKNLLKLRHESGDLNSSSHYHVKLICCLLTLVGSTLILLHTGMEWPFKGNQNKRFVAYYVSGENGNISRMFLSKTDWRYHGEKVVFDHSCYEASKALSVLCGDSSLIFIFYSVAISTEILAHYSCFMEKNEKSRSGLNFINSIKDLPQQNIWK